MPHQDQTLSTQAQPSSQPTVAPMRTLSAEEMRAVVGGPIIENGMGIAATSQSGNNG